MSDNFDLKYDIDDLDRPLMWILSPKAKDINMMLNMKASIGAALASLDRVFLGSFGNGLDLEGTPEQYEMFKKLFPAIGKALENTDGLDGMVSLCRRLSNYRNCCMHPNVPVDRKLAKINPEFIKELPNYSKHPYILENNRLTLAGFLAILMMMSNKEISGNFFLSGMFTLVNEIGLFPDYETLSGRSYSRRIEETFGNDFEVELRRTKGSDIITSLCGEYLPRVKKTDDGWQCYMNGHTIQNSDYFLFFRIDNYAGRKKILRVRKGSFYHVYYPQEFLLSIDDEDLFVELANMVPPFMILPYLSAAHITVLNRQNFSENRIFLYSKLNKAKFYVDKNVNTILMGDNYPDIRIISKSVAPHVLYCLLKMENDLSDVLKVNENKNNPMNTRIMEVLRKAGVNEELIREAVALRNFFAHGSIFGDYIGKALAGFMKIGLDHCLNIFGKLVNELKTKYESISVELNSNVAKRICRQLVEIKYNDGAMKCAPILNGMETDLVQYSKTMNRIIKSYIRKEIEDIMSQFICNSESSEYHVCDCLVNPGTILKCNGQVFDEDRIVFFSGLPIDVRKVIGNEPNEKLVECRHNSIVDYQRYDFR